MAEANLQGSTDKFTVLVIAEPGNVSDHLTGGLAHANDLELLGPFRLGVDGVSTLRKRHVDCIIVDIGMRNENALVSMSRILKIDQKAKVLMASTLSFENVKKSMAGFDQGAAEFVQTPAVFTKQKSRSEFDLNLIRVARSLAQARRDEGIREINNAPLKQTPPSSPPELRPFKAYKPDIIAIASSTGGPQALYNVIGKIDATFDVPILITQHMPKTFTGVLAANLAKRTNKSVAEGKDDEVIRAGRIYIAPGDFHMEVRSTSGLNRIKLHQEPPVNFCRPSADPMLASIAKVFGSKVCTIILTGMGSDGKEGAKEIVDAGGQVVAQDFESSVVWGMPGAVSTAGYCSKILPLDEIGPLINRLLNK